MGILAVLFLLGSEVFAHISSTISTAIHGARVPRAEKVPRSARRALSHLPPLMRRLHQSHIARDGGCDRVAWPMHGKSNVDKCVSRRVDHVEQVAIDRQNIPNMQHREGIAIIGSACRLPGGATSPSKLWQQLIAPQDLLREAPSSRFSLSAFHNEDGTRSGATNVNGKAYLLDQDPAEFDAAFFSLSPAEAEGIDPQQRILLEVTYEALESAGYSLNKISGSSTGVYVGSSGSDYRDIQNRDLERLGRWHATGTASSIIANRISHFYDLRGPCLTIDTACSSSLVGLHLAVQAICGGDCEQAIVAGSNLILDPTPYVSGSKLKLFSPDAQCRMWDSSANGYGRGEGVAVVILKPLENALRDGDHIECVIRGTGVNQDGLTPGITMPSAEAQKNLIKHVYAKAGYDPLVNTPSFFEAHGTGTPAGDPVEARAIYETFFEDNEKNARSSERTGKLSVGSIKTVIGHLEGAAGIAGLLKASLALQHRQTPPNLLFHEPNPALLSYLGSLEVPVRAQEWPPVQGNTPQLASVNSFGFGGTNAHCLLEAFPPGTSPAKNANITHEATVENCVGPFVLSAQSGHSLQKAVKSLAEYLKFHPEARLSDLLWTLSSRRSKLGVRASFVAKSRTVLIKRLEEAANSAKDSASFGSRPPARLSEGPSGSLGIFTGQGAQWATMGRELYRVCVQFKESIDRCQEALEALPDGPQWSIAKEMIREEPESRLKEAAIAQPLCTALQIALIDLVRRARLRFDTVVGHSSGEIAACYYVGLISARDAICIAYYRGLHSGLAGGYRGRKGAMMAVSMTYDVANKFCTQPEFQGRIQVAAHNARSSVTLSGDAEAIYQAHASLTAAGTFARTLKVETAYHSSHMLPCSKAYLASLRDLNIQLLESRDDCDWISSVRPKSLKTWTSQELEALKSQYWIDNMVQPVLFCEAIQQGLQNHGRGFERAVEIGPHPALAAPAKDAMMEFDGKTPPFYTGVLNRGAHDVEAVSAAIGLLWEQAADDSIDVSAYAKAVGPERAVPCQLLKGLPSYEWDHKHFWRESRLSRAIRQRKQSIHPLLGSRLPAEVRDELRWRNILRVGDLPYLVGHMFQGQTMLPLAAQISMIFDACNIAFSGQKIGSMDILDLKSPRGIIVEADGPGTEMLSTLRIKDQVVRADGSTAVVAEYSCHVSYDPELGIPESICECEVRLMLGSNTPTKLPARACNPPSTTPVSSKSIYESFSRDGLSYSDVFKRLNNVHQAMGFASASAFWSHDELKDHAIHPAVLDVGFQLMIPATFSQHGEDAAGPYLPVHVGCISIRQSVDSVVAGDELSLAIDAFTSTGNSSSLLGDITFYDESGECIVQVEALELVPFSKAQASNDRRIFTKEVWTEDCFGLTIHPPEPRAYSDNDGDLAAFLDRLCLYYFRSASDGLLIDDMPESSPRRLLLRDMKAAVELVRSGDHPTLSERFLHDSHESLLAGLATYGAQPLVKKIQLLGESLPAILRGGTRQSLLIDQAEKLHDPRDVEVNRAMAFFAQHITQKFPNMNILDIGNGDFQTTKLILQAIGTAYRSYVCGAPSDVSVGMPSTEHEVRVEWKSLDVLKDLHSQGIEHQKYDLLISLAPVHGGEAFRTAVANMRSLLRPGGYLFLVATTGRNLLTTLMLGTHSTAARGYLEDRNTLTGNTMQELDSLLLGCGFSGLEQAFPDSPHPAMTLCSVVATQAVSDMFNIIRNPLPSIGSIVDRKSRILLIGGRSLATAKLVRDIRRVLSEVNPHITILDSIERLEGRPSGDTYDCLCLADLDQPVLGGRRTAKTFECLQRLYGGAKNLLWYTAGRLHSPEASMSVGIGRSLRGEVPWLNAQFIDVSSAEDTPARAVVEAYCRLLLSKTVATSHEDVLWTLEPELVIQDNRTLISRVVRTDSIDDRFNAGRRPIIRESAQSKKQVRLEQDPHGHVFLLEDLQTPPVGQPVGTCSVDVRYSAALTDGGATGSVVCFGHQLDLSWRKQAVFAVSKQARSTITTSEDLMFACELPVHDPIRVLSRMAKYLQAAICASHAAETGCTLLYGVRRELVGMIQTMALQRSKSIVIVSALHDDGECTDGTMSIHPMSTRRTIRQKLPMHIDLALNCSAAGNDELWDRMVLTLQCRRETVASHPSLDWPPLLREAFAEACHFMETHPESPLPNVIPLHEVGKQTSGAAVASAIISWQESEAFTYRVAVLEPSKLFSDRKTYFLAGMTGSLGLSVSAWMIRSGAKHLVLASRNPKISPQWLDEMASLGANIKVQAVDISQTAALANALDEIRSTMPPIAGVCNASLVLSDGLFADATFDSFDRTLKAKVDGSRNLDRLFSNTHLDFFVLFGSIGSVIGIPGQANYHAANLYMESLVTNRRNRGLAASVMDIGIVTDVGLVQREGEAVLTKVRRQHVEPVSEATLHHLFGEAILASPVGSGSEPKIIVGPKAIFRTLDEDKRPVWYSDPRLSHFLINDVLETAETKEPASSLLAHLQQASSEDSMLELLLDPFQSKLETFLGMDKGTIAATGMGSLLEMGVDSGIALQVSNWLSKEVQATIPVMKILTTPNITQLCLDLVRQIAAITVSPAVEGSPVIRGREVSSLDSHSDRLSPSQLISARQSSTASSSPRPSSSFTASTAAVTPSSQSSVSEEESHPTRSSLLSPGQAQLWAATKTSGNGTKYNMTFQFDCEGPISPERLQSALHSLIQHQEVLRSAFAETATGECRQYVWEDKDVSRCFEHVACGDLRQADEEYERLAHHCWQLSEGDTFKLVLTSDGSGLRHVITFAAHHIIMDGMSITTFFHHLALAYQRQKLPPLGRSYTVYAEEQLAAIAAHRFDSKLQFWKTILTPAPASMPLFPVAISASRKPLDRSGGDGIITVKGHMSASQVDSIKSTSRKLQCTPFHFTTTALIVLCAKMLHLEDVCIGITDAGRQDHRDGETVGHFANMLPLRTRIESKGSMADLVHIVRSNIAQAAENAEVPFPNIVRASQVQRSTTHFPVFQVALNFVPADATTQFDESTMRWRMGRMVQSPTDVNLWVFARSDGSYPMQLDGRSDVYSADGLELLLETYVSLVGSLCRQPDEALEKLDTFSRTALQAASKAGLGETKDFGWDKTIAHRFETIARQNGDTVAVVDETQTLTYQELQQRVHLIASLLQAELLAPGSAVAVMTGPSVNTLASMLAILRIRCVYVPLDLSLPAARHKAMIGDCNAKVLLFEDSTAERARALQVDYDLELCNVLELLANAAGYCEVANTSEPDDPAIILYTSGSTFVPKGVLLPQAGYLNYIAAKSAALGVEREVVLQQSSISFDMGLAQMLHSCCNAGTLVVVPQHARGDPVAVAKLMRTHRVTFTIATPTEYVSWLSTSSDMIDQYDRWRHACCGGEFVSRRLLAMFRGLQRQNPLINNSYGPTEASCATTLCLVEEFNASDVAGYVGKPLANSHIRIVDAAGVPLPLGHPGEICISGRGLALGYINPEDTRKRFVGLGTSSSCQSPQRMYRTGDRGRLLADGSLILMGRMEGDTQVKVHGVRIDVTEIEHALLHAIPGFLSDAVVSMRREEEEAFLVAHVVLSTETNATKAEIQLLTRLLRLPQYMLPRHIIALTELPTTASGKIDRRSIAQLPIDTSRERTSTAAQLVEAEVCRIWQEVLKPDEPFDPESDFFLVGGDSLLLVQLQAGIKNRMGLAVSLAELYEASTLQGMAAKIGKLKESQPPPAPINWNRETQVPDELIAQLAAESPDEHGKWRAIDGDGVEVVLTGATDFLGYEILLALLNEPRIRAIHCLATPAEPPVRFPMLSDPRVRLYPGSLRHPTLSLDAQQRRRLQESAHVIIHAGAEGHCLNNYPTLRKANLLSAHVLAELALPHRLPIHFVSGARVTLLSGNAALPPVSVATHHPAADGHDGYTATKWAVECFLQALTQLTPELPVTIHRPCAVTGERASPDNVMNALVRASAAIKAVPRNERAEGYVDFKDVGVVAEDVVRQVIHDLSEGYLMQGSPSPAAGLRFIHHSSGHKIAARDLRRRMEMLHPGTFRELDLGEWLALAKSSAGLPDLAAVFLEAMMDDQVTSVYPYMGESVCNRTCE